MPVWLVDEPVFCRFFMFFICGLPHLYNPQNEMFLKN